MLNRKSDSIIEPSPDFVTNKIASVKIDTAKSIGRTSLATTFQKVTSWISSLFK